MIEAAFSVISLNTEPAEVVVGEQASIVALIENTGGVEGIYTTILIIDDSVQEIKEVDILPWSSEVVTFSLVKDTPGIYQISVGGLNSTLKVKVPEKKLVAKEIELGYDDGEARGYLPVASGGYLVDFSPTVKPFIIQKIRMMGMLSGDGSKKNDTFRIEIWGVNPIADTVYLLYTDKYPVSIFNHQIPDWVTVDIPDIEVNWRFYVHVYTEANRDMYGIRLGSDDSVINEHSEVTYKLLSRILIPEAGDFWPYKIYRDRWPYVGYTAGDKSKANWMIRVIGTIMVPD